MPYLLLFSQIVPREVGTDGTVLARCLSGRTYVQLLCFNNYILIGDGSIGYISSIVEFFSLVFCAILT
jgi:hypothetical protein